MVEQRPAQCPDQTLAEVAAVARASRGDALVRLDAMIRQYPKDSRLRFLQGSLLAAEARYSEARVAMREAIDVEPDYAIARYQLGLLELTSGDAAAAIRTWGPLQALPRESPLRLFAEGLTLFASDQFDAAIPLLNQGMRLNTQLPEMNADVRLLLDALSARQGEAEVQDEPVSAAHLLLQQYKDKLSRH